MGGVSIPLVFATLALTAFNGPVDLHFTKIGNPLLFLIIGITGCTSLMFLSIFLEKYNFAFISVLKYLGKHSLIIMASHVNFRIIYLSHAYIKHWYVFQDKFWYSLSVALVTTVICCVIVEIFNKNFDFIFNYSAFCKRLRYKNG